jgi:DNA-binding response OmpR family regulator
MEHRALVVERFAEMREVISLLLTREHYRVDTVSEWSDVPEVDRRRYDVIVADVPFDETARSVERRIAGRDTVVASRLLLMSANNDTEAAESEILHKPFDRAHFVDAVRRVTAA